MPTNTIVTGPVAGGRRGWPFSLPLTDLASVGYVAEEFFLDGTAAAYEAEPGAELTVDGKWQVRPSRTAPFRTRVLVVRPVDRALSNGLVHVNWQNVTAGFELVSPTLSPLLDGFAWVGVSAQRVGVHGFPGSVQLALRGWDPERFMRRPRARLRRTMRTSTSTAPTVDVDGELAKLDADGYRPLGISLVGCDAERALRTDGHG
jgi:hypothetical protein